LLPPNRFPTTALTSTLATTTLSSTASLRLRLLRPGQVATPTRRADHGQYAAVVPHLHPEHSGGGDVPPGTFSSTPSHSGGGDVPAVPCNIAPAAALNSSEA